MSWRVVGAWFRDGEDSGVGGRVLLCVEVLVSEELSSVDENIEESSESDSEESGSSVVSWRRGRPRDRRVGMT